MTTFLNPLQRPHSRLIGAALVSLLLAACGGGGDGPAPIPTVSSVSVVPGSAKYGQDVVIAVTGTDVDQALFVSSAACYGGVYLSTSRPYESNSATAYYRCRIRFLGTGLVTVGRVLDNVALGSATFTVPSPQVSMTASDGVNNATMVFTLFPGNAPLTVNNFLNYVNSGFYLGTIFHRVGNSLGIIQGGGYQPLTVGTAPVLKANNTPPIALEATGLSNQQWSLAMARGDAPDSATSQFFINVVNNPLLDGRYAVFGTVNADASRDAVTYIDTAPCTGAFLATTGSECAPVPNLIITAATQIQ